MHLNKKQKTETATKKTNEKWLWSVLVLEHVWSNEMLRREIYRLEPLAAVVDNMREEKKSEN